MEMSYIFGKGQKFGSPEELARARALYAALSGNQPVARDVGEGLAVVGNAIKARRMLNDINASDAAGKASWQPFENTIAAALQGPSAFPPAPSGQGAEPMDYPSQRVAQAFGDNDIAAGIKSTAQALGIDPVDLGTAISYETAGTFDPRKRGPTTQWGQHEGLIQFGEPQAKQFGVDWNNPVQSQLGPDGAVAKYLRSTGVKPGMGLLDIYSAINAGGVGRYGASDANNGGAPGTVRDKVEQQMAGHRAKAMALLGQPGAQQPAPAQQAIAQALGGQQTAPPLPEPRTVQDRPVATVAEALAGTQQQQSDMPGFVPIDAKNGPDAGLLFRALGNPFAPDEQRALVGGLLKQKLAGEDPNAALDAEYKRAQIENLKSEAAQRNNPNARDKYGNNPVWGKDKNGKWVLFQLNNAGGLAPAQAPDGIDLIPPGVGNLDLGTAFGIRDRAGEVINTVPKDLVGAEREKAIGAQQGAQIATAPADIQSAQNALDTIEAIRTDPNLDRGTGLTGLANVIPGTAGYDFQNRVNQAKSGAFLTAIQQMRGLGALSNAEGETATAAVTRMDTATSKEAFLSALADYEKVVRQGMTRARARLEGKPIPVPPEPAPQATSAPAAPQTDKPPPSYDGDPELWKYMSPEDRKLWQ